MSPSPPYVTDAHVIGLIGTYLLMIVNGALIGLNLHTRRKLRQRQRQARDYVVRMTVREVELMFATELEVRREPVERARNALMTAQHAAGIALGELDAYVAEKTMKEQRHVP